MPLPTTHQLTLPFLHTPAPTQPSAAPNDLATSLGHSFMTLNRFPRLSSADVCRHAPEIGNAGEALVSSWAARRGLHPVTAPAGAQFDHIFSVGQHLIRLQTKTTVSPGRDGKYHFRMTRGNSGDPNGTCRYTADAFDIAALVFLDLGVVYFTAANKVSFKFTPQEAALIAQAELECFYDCLLTLGIISQCQFDELTADDASACG